MNLVIATPSMVEAREAPQVIHIKLAGVATGEQAPQIHKAIARAIQVRIAEDEDDDDDDDDAHKDDDDDDDGDDDDEDDSIGELREQVELLRDEVHELHELVERVISRE